MPAGDIFRLRVFCSDPNLTQIGVNTTYWQVTSASGLGATYAQTADAFDFALSVEYRAYLSSESTYRGVSVQQVEPGPLSLQVFNNDSFGVGTNGAAVLPGQDSPVVSWATTLAGPRFRGRIFLPFPSANAINATGRLTALAISLYASLGTAYVTPVVAGVGPNTSTLRLCLRSEVIPHTVPKVYIYPLVVTGSASAKMGTQRKRGDYGRLNLPPI